MAKLPALNTRSLCRNLRSYFHEYCLSSSIHGIRYFGEKRTIYERGWWLIVFLMCLSCCAYFITMVYQKWENSPVIVSFATREKLIHEIPFPAVTICPESKADKELYSHSKLLSKLFSDETLTPEEFKRLSFMNLVCDDISTILFTNFYNKSTERPYFKDQDFFDFLFNVTPNVFNKLRQCKWMNKEIPCEDIFDLVLTDEGICATFNMLENSRIYSDLVYFPDIPWDPKNRSRNVTWSLDEGYSKEEDIDTFPRRALFSGAKNSLYVVLAEHKNNIDPMCKLSMQGFKVSLHTPTRVPRPSQQYFRLPLNEAVISAVNPVMITTSDTVRQYKPAKRECYFQNEKPLKYFKVYTQRNCQLECLTEFTLDWCWCVNFFMPRENKTDICGSMGRGCMEEAEEILQKGHLSNLLGLKHKKKNSTDDYIDEVPNCNCLPLCTDLSYEVETSSSIWDWQSIGKALFPNSTGEATDNIALSNLIIYFKNNQFITSKRHELFSMTDFLGNFGGLLGLFTGFSILSLMEIIYFLTVRIICNIKLYDNWSGREKDLEKNI